MPTGEWNDFGESFFGLLRLVAAARNRLPRKNPDADVCREQSSLTFSGSHNADIRACTGAPRHKPNSMERAPNRIVRTIMIGKHFQYSAGRLCVSKSFCSASTCLA